MHGGVSPHQQIGVDYLGGSWVKFHWDRSDEKHHARKDVESNDLDVLTLGGMHDPDDGIDHFTEAALARNPNVIVTLQEFWLPHDSLTWGTRPIYGELGESLRTWTKVPATDPDRTPRLFDLPTADQLEKLHKVYFDAFDKYVTDLNKKHGRRVIRIVPIGQAVIELRRKIISGEMPGVTKQSDLFTDATGHPKKEIHALSAYCHYIVIYHKDPRGISGITRENLSPETNRILQELAWNAVINHPLSSFYQGKAE